MTDVILDNFTRVVVIGGGLAGTTAALSAADAVPPGAEVVLLEKEQRMGGNSAKASSGINALVPDQGGGDDAEAFRDDTLRSGGGLSAAPLIDALVTDSQDAVSWLEMQGVDLGGRVQLGGHTRERTRTGAHGPVGFSIMKALRDKVAASGRIRVVTGAKVESLVCDNGRVKGVEYATRDGGTRRLAAGAVVLATGGFGASTALLQKFAPRSAALPTTNGPWAQGEGLSLAEAAGAQLVHLDRVQVHPTGFVDPANPGSCTKFLAPEKLRGVGGILLGGDGRRFVDELSTREKVSQAVARQPGKQAFLLLGADAARQFGPSLGFYVDKGLLTKRDDLAAAAALVGVAPEALAAEVEAYNSAVARGRDAFGKTVFPGTVDPRATVHVARITPAVHYTMGGVAVDAEARALDATGAPVPGLFAVGEVTGGLHGANRLGGNSLLECVVFGRRAGRNAAAAG